MKLKGTQVWESRICYVTVCNDSNPIEGGGKEQENRTFSCQGVELDTSFVQLNPVIGPKMDRTFHHFNPGETGGLAHTWRPQGHLDLPSD